MSRIDARLAGLEAMAPVEIRILLTIFWQYAQYGSWENTEMRTYNVRAHWDADASVWWAESDDVPGLVAESETHDGLIEELRHVVPELLALNVPAAELDRAKIRITADQEEGICYA